MSQLLDAAAGARFIFVVGKGGVGKTTTAGALALDSADGGIATHLISTDPAHSLRDLFAGERCSERLVMEELDAAARAGEWLADTLGPVSALVERGTYLDSEDVTAFSRLALPGADEMMALLRLGELAQDDAQRVVVDTAPTGHTLRLLDASAIFESLAGALDAMADKAGAVAAAMVGAQAVPGEEVIARIRQNVQRYREDVLKGASFIVVARAGAVVEAETGRLLDALEQRGLDVAALVWTGRPGTLHGNVRSAFAVPRLDDVHGCAGLRAWSTALTPAGVERDAEDAGVATLEPAAEPHSFVHWLRTGAPPLLLFAGKGGVGKSTCAAAAALALSRDRDVLLCSADPAGSLDDVLGGEGAPRLRALQIDPAEELGRLRDEYDDDVNAGLDRIGLSHSAALDRRVVESLWDLTPPGMDEVAATVAMLRAARGDETIVLDAAPTGHFLRMLETPDTALAWVRQLMRVIVKYGIAGVAANAAESLVRLSRELKALSARLQDPADTAAVVVTLDEPLVQAETGRLADALKAAGVHVAATIVNRSTRETGDAQGTGVRVRAPLVREPRGVAALREFAATWKIVS